LLNRSTNVTTALISSKKGGPTIPLAEVSRTHYREQFYANPMPSLTVGLPDTLFRWRFLVRERLPLATAIHPDAAGPDCWRHCGSIAGRILSCFICQQGSARVGHR